MGSWYPAKGRGFIFGLWTCHQYIGDIAAAIFSAYILKSGYDWRLCIIVPAIINGIWAFVNFYSVPSRPSDVGLQLPSKTNTNTPSNSSKDSSSSSSSSKDSSSRKESAPEPIGFLQAFQLPNVLNYAVAFGFFKLVSFISVYIYLTMCYCYSNAIEGTKEALIIFYIGNCWLSYSVLFHYYLFIPLLHLSIYYSISIYLYPTR